MIQNKEILNKLIDNNSNNAAISDELSNKSTQSNKVPTGTDDEVLITTSRVVGVRYKVYTVVLLLLLFVLWYSYILPSYDQYQSDKISSSSMELQMLNFENTQLRYEANKGLVDKIQQVEPQVITCVNTLEWCAELPTLIKENFHIVRSYLLLHEMAGEKMELDEKTILANIDSFLLKKYPLEKNSRTMNWVLNKITIWDKQDFDSHLYFVPIELWITFSDKSWLLSFIDNVEKKIPLDENIRMLYKIDKISYDIVNADQMQDASVFMYLYFYEE